MDGFIGEIRAFCFNYVPEGWIACVGQTIPVNQSQALYAIIGNNFGGTPGSNFTLPDLRGVVMISQGQLSGGATYNEYSTGGTETVALADQSVIPSHSHVVNGGVTTTSPITVEVAAPAGTNYLSNMGLQASTNQAGLAYGHDSNPGANVPLGPLTIGMTGGGGPHSGAVPHNNMAPYLALTYCICYNGTFPVRP